MTRSVDLMNGWFWFVAGVGALPLTLAFEAVSKYRTPGVFVAAELFRGAEPGGANIVPVLMTMIGTDYLFCFVVIFGACFFGVKVYRDRREFRRRR